MSERYFFADFCLEPNAARLLKGDREVHLESTLFRILKLLLEDSPSIVTPQKLLAAAWNEPTLHPNASEKRKVAQAVYRLRQALNNAGGDETMIVTHSRQGYRFGIETRSEATQAPASTPVQPSDIPRSFTLSTKRTNPQWADFCDLLAPTVPWTLRCRIRTNSAYFRFGFKLLRTYGRLFGDASLQSADPNLIVHLGRNYWDRPAISRNDVFVTAYFNGIQIDADRKLFRASKRLKVDLELRVDHGYKVWLIVDGKTYFHHSVSAESCRRVAVLAWGDTEDYSIDIEDFSIHSSDELGVREDARCK